MWIKKAEYLKLKQTINQLKMVQKLDTKIINSQAEELFNLNMKIEELQSPKILTLGGKRIIIRLEDTDNGLQTES